MPERGRRRFFNYRQCEEIRALYADPDARHTVEGLAKRYRASPQTISKVIDRKGVYRHIQPDEPMPRPAATLADICDMLGAELDTLSGKLAEAKRLLAEARP